MDLICCRFISLNVLMCLPDRSYILALHLFQSYIFVFSFCCHVFSIFDVVFEQFCNNASLPDLTLLLRFQQCHHVLPLLDSSYASTFQTMLLCLLLLDSASFARARSVPSSLILCSALGHLPEFTFLHKATQLHIILDFK